eukprot:6193524-Pleurochrysis_carterae.AAC.4
MGGWGVRRAVVLGLGYLGGWGTSGLGYLVGWGIVGLGSFCRESDVRLSVGNASGMGVRRGAQSS